MIKLRFKCAVFITGFVSILLIGAYALWLFQSQKHQYVLDRALIAALVKNDGQQALLLVNEGADPNTPDKLMPPPSLHQLWEHLLHHSTLPANHSSTAFLIACEASWQAQNSPFIQCMTDDPKLVQAMLEHGANPNMRGGDKDQRMGSLYYSSDKL